MPATRRAPVVFPVPGLPVNTQCRERPLDLSPSRDRAAWILRKSASFEISFLTGTSPTRSSSSFMSSARLFCGAAGDAADAPAFGFCAAISASRSQLSAP